MSLRKEVRDARLKDRDQNAYRVLRVALRNAILRVVGTQLDDVSLIYRQIEDGSIGVGEATDKLEKLLIDLGESEAEKWARV